MSSSNERDIVQSPPQGRTAVSSDPLEDGPLHFRKEENGRLVMIGHCCTIVDIKVNEKALEIMKQGGKLVGRDDDKRVISFTWENQNSLPIIKRKLHVQVNDIFEEFYKSLSIGFEEDEFKFPREFVHELYREYHVRLVNICTGCVVFEIAHTSDSSVRKMEREKEKVLRICKKFLEKCTKRDINVTLTIETGNDDFSTGFSPGQHDQEEYGHRSSSRESNRNKERMDALAKQQALTKDKIRHITETLKYFKQSETESGDKYVEGTIGVENRKATQVTGDLESHESYRRDVTPPPFVTPVAIAASAREVHSRVNPFDPRSHKESKAAQCRSDTVFYATSIEQSAPGNRQQSPEESSAPRNSKTESYESGFHSETPSSADGDERVDNNRTAGLSAPVQQSSSHDPEVIHQRTQSVRIQETAASVTATSSRPTSDVETEDDKNPLEESSVTVPSSDGGAKPKVKGESPENIMAIVRSARGEKSDLGYKMITESVEAALVDEVPAPPRAESLDTVLCLDCSESMTGEAFVQMKRISETFVDGLEDIAGEYGLEENVAVVSMSDRARVVQHLTNDYSRVREAIDSLHPSGMSPVFETLMVSLAAIQGKGGVINISDVHRVRPRVVFITDGKATDENHGSGLDIVSPTSKIPLMRLIDKLGSEKQRSTPKPFVWIPVGSAEREFLNSLAKLGKGLMVEEEDVPKLARYFRIQESIGKIYEHVRNSPVLQKDIHEVIDALVTSMPREDKDEVAEAVLEKLKSHEEPKPDDFDNVFEKPELPPLGTRVIRGQDLKWDNQDSEGVGTVINHDQDDNWVWVLWDNGKSNRYGASDLRSVDDRHRVPQSEHSLQIGVRVQRAQAGPPGRQGSVGGETGVVIRTKEQNMVKVRWDNGHISPHKYERDGVKEVLICDPSQHLKRQSSLERKEDLKWGFPKRDKDSESKKGNTIWRWKDDLGQWHLYPEHLQQKLRQEYKRRPEGTCLVEKGDMNFRVFFKSMTEKGLESSVRHEIELLPVDDDELKNLMTAEQLL